MKKLKTNKGITLIALVITIIVLLILAAVSIATLTGENGILTQASNASNKSKEAEEREQIGLAYNAAMAENKGTEVTQTQLETELKKYDDGITVEQDGENFKVTYPNGHEYTVESNGEITGPQAGQTPPTPPTKDKPGKPDGNGIFTESSTIDGQKTSSKENPIIPEGFKPIDEGEAKWGDGTKLPAVDKGLVIEDIDHNQFVWVPVDKDNFKRAEAYENGSKQSYLSGCTEPFEGGYSTEEAEYNKMKSSVETNGGFYIGRYEAGNEGGTLKYNDGDASYYWEGNSKVVVKKGATVYNGIGWNGSGDFYGSMDDDIGGAVEKAKNFKIGKAYENSVTSTLVYGIQWDVTMQFFDNNYINGITNIENSYVSNSTGKGNYDEDGDYEGEVAKTGSSPEYSVKNIYDMAGNVSEWTMEAYYMANRVNRGGDCNVDGSYNPASVRCFNYPSCSVDYIGFRIALYVG